MSVQQLKRIVQSRIFLHVLFWMISFYILLQHFSISSEITKVDYIFTLLFHISLFSGVYLNLYFLIPRYLDRSNYWRYILGLVLLFVLVYLAHLFTFSVLADILFPGYYIITFSDWIEMLKYFIIYVGITTIFILSKYWFDLIDSRKKLAESERENLKYELKALKSQINPHFLFNSLNSIYSLALKKSDDAPEVILKLSDVLRYVIYESNESLVNLEDELKFIRHYIDLQKLRIRNPDSINLSFKGDPVDVRIAPLIFIVYIENAIKHGLTGIGNKDFVNINFTYTQERLLMQVENSYYPEDINNEKETGIGLENAGRRLEISYPGKHELDIENRDNAFIVKLVIVTA